MSKEIYEKYHKVLKSVEDRRKETSSELSDYCSLICEYSRFDFRIICILSNLISTFEGEEYCANEITFKREKIIRLVFDSDTTSINIHNRIIIPEKEMRDYYNDEIVSLLEKKGKLLVLQSDEFVLNDYVSFYRLNEKNNDIVSTVNFEKFPYVKDFINSVISYKMLKASKEISEEELEVLEKQFISSRKQEIEQRYKQLNEEQDRKLKEEQKNRQLQLERTFNKQ